MSAKANGNLRCHYTTSAGLLGILNTGEIWMSDPRFLNDAREWQHGANIVWHNIKLVAGRYRPAWLDRGCRPEAFDAMVGNLLRRFNNLPIASNDYVGGTPFIFSMSHDEDSLGQWRAYGNGDYCITFDAAELAKRTRSNLLEVQYRQVGADAEIEPCLENFFESHQCHIYGGRIDTEVTVEGWRDIESVLVQNHYFIGVKHPGFMEENEWRLVRYVFPKSDPRIDFKTRGRDIIPYVKVPIDGWPASAPSVIKKVICGPGVDHARATLAFEAMRGSLDFGFTPVASIVPYREV